MPAEQEPEKKDNGNSDKASDTNRSAALRGSLKITLIYIAVGFICILLIDGLIERLIPAFQGTPAASLVRAFAYIIVTAAVSFPLVYKPIKKSFDAKKELADTNAVLERSIESYKKLCRETEKKQMLTKALVNSTPDLIFYKNRDSVYIGCNKAFEAFAGKPENEIVGMTDYHVFSREDAESFKKSDMRTLEANQPYRSEAAVKDCNGDAHYLDTLKSPYYDNSGMLQGLIGVSRDISEKKKREEEVTYLSYHDILTGLYNRTFFTEEKTRMDTDRFIPISIIVGGVNGMKLVNDAFGHAEGDRVLAQTAEAMKRCIRRSDIAARIGGDEFAVLLPNTDNQQTKSIVERIRGVIAGRHTYGQMAFSDIALGYATKNSADESLEEAFVLAEDLMYRRKIIEGKSFHNSILTSIKATMFEKSYETEAHAERIAKLAERLGLALGLPGEKMDELELVASLHDIGKISVDQRILTKIEKLSEEDWLEIRKHPEVGYRITYASPDLRHISEYILCHHERWDGKGYPQGLSKEGIPLLSRIISVVDAYDAMTQDRAYRKAFPKEKAIEEIRKNAGTQFDPDIANTFIDKVIDGDDR